MCLPRDDEFINVYGFTNARSERAVFHDDQSNEVYISESVAGYCPLSFRGKTMCSMGTFPVCLSSTVGHGGPLFCGFVGAVCERGRFKPTMKF